MFGLFKKKSPTPPVRKDASKTSPLTEEQKRLIKEELERHAGNRGNDIDAAIGLLHLTGDQVYLQGLLRVLETAEVGILLKSPRDTVNHLTLVRDGLQYLPVVTQPAHAGPLIEKFPQYQHMAIVNARKLFLASPLGSGLWINLGHPFTTYKAILDKKSRTSS